jgi:hypothetical protein
VLHRSLLFQSPILPRRASFVNYLSLMFTSPRTEGYLTAAPRCAPIRVRPRDDANRGEQRTEQAMEDADKALKNIEVHLFNLGEVFGDMLSDMTEEQVRSIVQTMLEEAIEAHKEQAQ